MPRTPSELKTVTWVALGDTVGEFTGIVLVALGVLGTVTVTVSETTGVDVAESLLVGVAVDVAEELAVKVVVSVTLGEPTVSVLVGESVIVTLDVGEGEPVIVAE